MIVLFFVKELFPLSGQHISGIDNIQTLPSDLHCGKSVGSLAGLGGAAAVLGTILAILFADQIASWPLLFGLLATLVPLSLASVFLTVGKIEQIK